MLEDTAEARQALSLDAAGFTAPSDMYMPLVDGEPVSPLSLEQHQAELPFGPQRQHHRPALPAPRGLGLGLTRHVHSSRHPHLQQQEEETLQMLEDSAVPTYGTAAGDAVGMEASPSAPAGGRAGASAAAAAGSSGRHSYDADETAALAVDSAEAAVDGMFEDAITVGPDDLVCEGLPFEPGASFGTAAGPAAVAGSSMGGGGFIYLRGMGSEGVRGAFEAVTVPRVGGGAAAEDDVHMQAGPGLMHLQFNN